MSVGKFAFHVLVASGLLAVSEPSKADPSFDCSKASSRVEIMICENARLAQLDSELAEAYRTALRDSPWDSANRRIRAEQKEWISKRNRCRDERCLRHVYHDRIGELYAEVSGSGASNEAANADPDTMMAECRDRAAHVFHLRSPNIETKYEGQRTDGSHAVNGTAYLRENGEETFQCSFDEGGTHIVQFLVN